MITELKPVLKEAVSGGYAVGAFNVYNYETIRGALEASAQTSIPVIVALGERYLENMSCRSAHALVSSLSEELKVKAVLHLDHCKSLEIIGKAVEAGFSSVMFDGSDLPFEENIARTREAAAIAHGAGASVEAELGSVARGSMSNEEEGEGVYTDPSQAREYVEKTGVDALAVSIERCMAFIRAGLISGQIS